MNEFEKLLPWEQRAVCCHCCKPLADNQVVKDAYKANAVTAWAKGQLRILADILEDRDFPGLAKESRRIADGLKLL